jgi:hypothetical protein
VAAARNRGLAQACGEIVVFSDAHMDLPEAWWQPIADTLNRPEVGVVGPGIGVMGKPDRRTGCGQRIAEPTLRLQWLPRPGDEPCPVPTLGGGFMAMRHDTLKRAGAFDEGMPQWGSEDAELCLRYWLLGYEAWVVPEVTVLHYFRKQRPYGAEARLLAHNVLRVALLHFSAARMGRVLTALRNLPRFGPALAMALESDVWEKRAEASWRGREVFINFDGVDSFFYLWINGQYVGLLQRFPQPGRIQHHAVPEAWEECRRRPGVPILRRLVSGMSGHVAPLRHLPLGGDPLEGQDACA